MPPVRRGVDSVVDLHELALLSGRFAEVQEVACVKGQEAHTGRRSWLQELLRQCRIWSTHPLK